MSLRDRIKNAWNAFRYDKNREARPSDLGSGTSSRPDRPRYNLGNERSIISSIFTRLSIDVSQTPFHHVRLDQNGRFLEILDTSLNECLTISANTDQTGKAFIQDAAMSLFDEGCVALVPTDTSVDPNEHGGFDIFSLRTGRVEEWYPAHVRINLYNEKTGHRESILMKKDTVAIIENPLYSIMNEPNSTLQRLIRKLNLLDVVDDISGSGKLDLVVQLPYTVRSDLRKAQAVQRRLDIEEQLANGKYGIAYIDATEKITQLNRPAENNLMGQIEFLTRMLYGQLGITEAIFLGTADEKAMLNYYTRSIDPILNALLDAMVRSFLSRTARAQKQTLKYFRDPFKLVPAAELANSADAFTRNAILTSNEIRSVIGYPPSSEPDADKLRNKNLNQAEEKASENQGDKNEESV